MERPFVDPNSVVDSGDGVVEVRLPSRPESSRLARAYVQQQWPDLSEVVLSDVELIATELVTNAVRHGAPVIRLRLRREPFAVDVAVLDGSTRLPPTRVAPVSVDSHGGRGLAIVDALAERWGVDVLPADAGKSVWATVCTAAT